jgi:peptidoglycan/xylan/chitin deacetylase (PgdA/CDA1 family)
MKAWTRRAATALLQLNPVSRAVRALARARGHSLVLVYHRLGPPVPPNCEIVPAVPVDVFRAQLQALGEIVDLVALHDILTQDTSPSASGVRRPAVAITFDDDLQSHVEHALPVLREFGVPAAFFLSGRALHGLGPYWFEQLEMILIAYGERRTATLLGRPGTDVARLVLACQRDPELRGRVREHASDLPTPVVPGPEAISALADAGMTIGFHTVDHSVLPILDDPALEEAVSRGRQELAAIAGAKLRYFAYPHGKTDERSAAAVRRAGFEAAFTGTPRPVRRGDDRHRLGRWEPGAIGSDDLVRKLAVRLHRAAPVAQDPR